MIKAQPIRKRTKLTALVNPRRKAAKAKAAKKPHRPKKVSGAPRRNPGATVLLGYLNPPEKKMQKQKTQKHKTIRRKASNPIRAKALPFQKKHRPRRKNPVSSISAGIFKKPIDLLQAGAIAAVAFFATKQVPRAVLKQRDQLWIGYLANLLTALGCTAMADRYLGPNAARSAFVGGGMYLFQRILTEQTDFGSRFGMQGLVPGYWAQPPVVDRQGRPVFQPQLAEFVKQQIPPPAPAPAPAQSSVGVSGGRFASRW